MWLETRLKNLGPQRQENEAAMIFDGMKQCSECAKEGIGAKPTSEFRQNPSYRDGLTSWCKHHLNQYGNRWRKAHPAQSKAGTIRAKLLKSYNLTVERYAQLYTDQHGKCAICGKALLAATDVPPGAGRHVKKMIAHVDHCHDTKRVRGLLCSCCNTGIGQLQESEDILLSAIRYLKGASDEKPTP